MSNSHQDWVAGLINYCLLARGAPETLSCPLHLLQDRRRSHAACTTSCFIIPSSSYPECPSETEIRVPTNCILCTSNTLPYAQLVPAKGPCAHVGRPPEPWRWVGGPCQGNSKRRGSMALTFPDLPKKQVGLWLEQRVLWASLLERRLDFHPQTIRKLKRLDAG